MQDFKVCDVLNKENMPIIILKLDMLTRCLENNLEKALKEDLQSRTDLNWDLFNE